VTFGIFLTKEYLLKDRTNSIFDNVDWFIIPVAIASIFNLLMEFIFKPILKSPESEIEQTRLQRREKILEEKLRKLEMLKSADLESLIKSRKENT
jgi:hypothetical protein